MKRVLIISPYFPPLNAADMQRVRMSLPYFKEFGWEAEVVTVDPRFTDVNQDTLLNESLPLTLTVHKVKALRKQITSKIGLGSVALRSLFFFRSKVDQLLKAKAFDLIYFSTTQFPVCVLGAYWKSRFGVPYVIDMQDPWLTYYYAHKPKNERPPKYWIAHFINRKLEPIAMKKVDGLISVSEGYLTTLSERYSNCKTVPQSTITFGFFDQDFCIAEKNRNGLPSVLPRERGKVNVVYIGRGGADMSDAVTLLFQGFKDGLKESSELFQRIHFYFIGTSYAAGGKGVSTILPVAREVGVSDFVTEITDRIPFYQTINTLADADALFVPGSNDAQYTASKIYPYVMARRPLLTIFHPQSSVVSFLQCCGIGTVLTFGQSQEAIRSSIKNFLQAVVTKHHPAETELPEAIHEYSAKRMTEKQCALFERVIHRKKGDQDLHPNKRIIKRIV